jgi:hypothetical protein
VTEHVRAALRAVTRRMVEGAPYEELSATLDAIATMPGADELRAEIAGRRLALLSVHHRDAAERSHVLAKVAPDIASVPLPERVSWLVGAGREKHLVEPHLRPLLAEIEATAARDPDDAHAQHALWLANAYLGEEQPRRDEPGADPGRAEDEEPEADAPDVPPPWSPEVSAGLEIVRWLLVGRRPYEELSEALDAVLELSGGELAAGLVANRRLILVSHHDRDDAEAERVLAQVAPILATFSVQERAEAVSALCVGRPALAEKYVPPLIAELEEELRQRPDAVGEAMLASIERGLACTRAGG